MSDSSEHSRQLGEGEFMRLFVKHEPALRAFARSVPPDWNSVDDALQEASVTMWEKLGQLRDEDGFLPWAKVILRFKCLSTAAASRRHQHVLSDAVLELLADEAEAMSSEDVANVRQALNACLTKFSDAVGSKNSAELEVGLGTCGGVDFDISAGCTRSKARLDGESLAPGDRTDVRH